MQIIANRYHIIETLGEGNMGTVYRCMDKLTSTHVALKRVLIGKNINATMTMGVNARTALIQEFKTLATLRHPHIISVLDYGFDAEKIPFFTMTWLENAQYFVSACKQAPFDRKLEYVEQMLQALVYLHRRGIIHRDLKPTNVLVQDGQVKVLDFGLATGDTATKSDEVVVGTLQYMSPEVLRGEGATFSSDLYAVGLMLYDIFSPTPPFNSQTITQLIHEIMTTIPDTTRLDVSVELQTLIAQLLEKYPQDRPHSADDVLRQLSRMRGIAVMEESDSIRDSFLQAAKFVGRDAEFSQLSQALNQTIQGKSGLWLVTGESGVGKSRLIDELRVYALVKGMNVLRGQAVSESSAPYMLWREVLRHLCLQTQLSDLEASILKPIVPDIEVLLGRTIPDAPEVEPKVAQQRLFRNILGMIARQNEPILLILEDVHWAKEGLLLLEALAKELPSMPLLIVVTYRQDEMPDLPDRLPNHHLLKLDRFNRDTIQELAISMLGEGAGSQPPLIDLLQRESEGNIFFVIEVVRALGENVGELARIGDWLPQSVYAGGIQKVIERRLAGIPSESIPLLNLSAIAGRELDLGLLAHLSPQTDLTQWLSENSNLGILDAQEDRWRFSHDKLREGLIQHLEPALARDLHGQVAEGLLHIYGEDVVPARLGYHYAEAGRSQYASHWLILAGEQALRAGALDAALDFLHQTIAQQEQFPAPKYQLSRTYRLIGRAYFGMGKVQESGQAVQKALSLCGIRIPKSQLGLLLGMLWQGSKQAIYQTRIIKPRANNPELDMESLKACILMNVHFGWSGGQLRTNYLGVVGLNLSDKLYPADITATSYSGMGYFLSISRMNRLANYYLNKALRVTENTPNTNLQLDTQYSQGLMMIHRGQFHEAKALLLNASQHARNINDDQRWLVIYSQHISASYFLGQYTEMLDALETVEAYSRAQNNLQYIVWGIVPRGIFALRRGDNETATAIFTEADELLKQGKDALAKIFVQGGLALSYLYAGQLEQALTTADDLFRRTYKKRPFGHAVLEGYPAVVEAYTALSLRADDPATRKKCRDRADKTMQALAGYSKIFLFAQSRLWAWRGIQSALKGKWANAERAWEKSKNLAKQYQMPFDEGLASYLLGLRPNHEADARHADAIFARLGVTIPLDQAILSQLKRNKDT